MAEPAHPVWTARQAFDSLDGMKSILVPVDGSEASCRAAAFSANLARAFQSKVILFHVYDAPAAALLGLASLGQEAVQKTLASVAEGSFEKALMSMADYATIEIEKLFTTGHPHDQIVSHAKSKSCDLVVMGSRGLSPLEGFMLGSISDRVLRFAHCPVTVVR